MALYLHNSTDIHKYAHGANLAAIKIEVLTSTASWCAREWNLNHLNIKVSCDMTVTLAARQIDKVKRQAEDGE